NETGGRATSAASAAALAFVEALQDAASARGHTLAVASLVKQGVFDPSANPITSLEVRDNIWDGIRGRAFNGVYRGRPDDTRGLDSPCHRADPDGVHTVNRGGYLLWHMPHLAA